MHLIARWIYSLKIYNQSSYVLLFSYIISSSFALAVSVTPINTYIFRVLST
jgi:hypothetical protein